LVIWINLNLFCDELELIEAASAPHRSIVVLHRADQAPDGRLYDLEDAFENAEFEYGGQRTDCSKVIFVLETGFAGGSELAAEACGGFDCGVSPAAETCIRKKPKCSFAPSKRKQTAHRVPDVFHCSKMHLFPVESDRIGCSVPIAAWAGNHCRLTRCETRRKCTGMLWCGPSRRRLSPCGIDRHLSPG
jgi:hypothetical protein